MNQSPRRGARGFILIVVLFIMLVLAIVATAFFTKSEQTARSATAASGQQVALARAELAAQDAVRAIRSNQLPVNGLFGRPAPEGVAGCGNVNCITRVAPAGPDTISPREGGGMQWEWVVYRSSQAGTPANRFTIQANGFFGYNPASMNFTTARVEVEIDVGNASGLGAANWLSPGMGAM